MCYLSKSGLLLFNVVVYISIHFIPHEFILLYDWIILFLHSLVCVKFHFLLPAICWQTPRLIPYLGYYNWHFNKHGHPVMPVAYIFFAHINSVTRLAVMCCSEHTELPTISIIYGLQFLRKEIMPILLRAMILSNICGIRLATIQLNIYYFISSCYLVCFSLWLGVVQVLIVLVCCI